MNRINPTYQKAFEVHQFTGQVAESAKNMETKVTGGGGGGSSYRGSGYTAPVSIRSTTVVHDQIFLINKEGKEKSFQLQDFNLACRSGNELTIYWYIRVGSSSGKYFFVKNHSTDTHYTAENESKVMFLNRAFILLLGILAVILLFQAHTITFLLSAACVFFIWRMIKTAKSERLSFLEKLRSTGG